MSRIVVTGRIPEEGLADLRAQHTVDVWSPDAPREELLQLAAGADALVTLLNIPVDAELLDAAGDRLKAVANVAVGYDNIDLAACTERGVTVTNTPDVLTDATADIAFSLILGSTRRLGEAERLIRSGTPWKWGMFFHLGRSIQGKRLGIIGMGAIGQATARRAKAFGMEIVYYSRSAIDPRIAAELDAERLEFDELLRTSDVLSLHCPLTPETRHLIGPAEFEAMKDTAYLVNSARGPLVDEAALAEALRAGSIAGAGLDVYEDEPRIHPGLLEAENVVLLPHLGSATMETRTAMAILAAQNVNAILAGEEPATPVR